jgi:hypothetical protein
MKITIEIDGDDGDDEARILRMLNADRLHGALHEIREEIFRPARKHGYEDKGINDAFNAANTTSVTVDGEQEGAGAELIGLLEDKFHEILRNSRVELE